MKNLFIIIAMCGVLCTLMNSCKNRQSGQMIASGETGDCRWEIRKCIEGIFTLYIRGSGEMGDGETRDDNRWIEIFPWDEYQDSITVVNIGKGVTSIRGITGLSNLRKLTNIFVERGNTEFSSCSEGVLFNNDKTVFVLLFCPKGKTGSYTIPNGVMGIGAYAFSASKLTDITIPNSVKIIGEHAFAFSSLTSLTIPDGVEEIGEGVVAFCHDLTSINIGNGITCIARGTFGGAENITSVTIGRNVRCIESGAFVDSWRCHQPSKLGRVEVPNHTDVTICAFPRSTMVFRRNGDFVGGGGSERGFRTCRCDNWNW
jgi:hypothetical protein